MADKFDKYEKFLIKELSKKDVVSLVRLNIQLNRQIDSIYRRLSRVAGLAEDLNAAMKAVAWSAYAKTKRSGAKDEGNKRS